MNDELVKAISELEEDKALSLVNEALDSDADPLSILDACQTAVAIVGDRFEKNEYYLPELMMAGEMLREISELVKPKISSDESERSEAGKIVIGTVRGDIHNIGKDIVIFMLEANGYSVYDLGVDVPEEKFVEAVRDLKPQMLGLSGLLTSVFPVFKSTIDAIKDAGLRDKVKIVIGGGQVDEKVMEYTGADGYADLAVQGVTLAKQWVT